MTTKKKSTELSRRDLLRRGTAMGIAVGGVSTGAVQLDHGPVQETQAIAPAIAAAGVGASVAAGWALREFEVLGSDDPPEGETPESLKNSLFNTAADRESNNDSTIIDNRNIISGITSNAYADGKIAAIEKLNEEESQSVVLDAAIEAIGDYEKTIVENFTKSADETIRQMENILSSIQEHDDLDLIEMFDAREMTDDISPNDMESLSFSTNTETLELETHEIEYLTFQADLNYPYTNSTGSTANRNREHNFHLQESQDDDLHFWKFENGAKLLKQNEWYDMFHEILGEFDSVYSGIETWVDGVYADLQQGDLDVTELLTPRERAELTSDDEEFPQAIADLQALNISVDIEREAEIHLPEIGATIYGQLGYGGDEALSTGEIDPDDKDDIIYLTYDVSQGEGEWTAYHEGIDGGVLTFTAEPFVETVYIVSTSSGETVELYKDDFEESDDDDDEWTVDLSDNLDDSITNVDDIEYFADSTGTQYETIQLRDPFEIITYTDSEGNEYEESDFERVEPHTDDNYITKEEWEEQQERQNELIEKYEDAQNDGIAIPGAGDILEGEANTFIGMVIVGVVAVVSIFSALNPLS